MPLPFAKRLKSIIRNLPESSIAMQDLQPPSTSHPQNSSDQGADRTSRTPDQFSENEKGNMQAASSSSHALHFRTPWLKAEIFDTRVPNHRALFIIKHGTEFKLAQIRIKGLCCHIFFSTLRRKYFQLRGFLRSWFRVWQYSHCDFSMAIISRFHSSSNPG